MGKKKLTLPAGCRPDSQDRLGEAARGRSTQNNWRFRFVELRGIDSTTCFCVMLSDDSSSQLPVTVFRLRTTMPPWLTPQRGRTLTVLGPSRGTRALSRNFMLNCNDDFKLKRCPRAAPGRRLEVRACRHRDWHGPVSVTRDRDGHGHDWQWVGFPRVGPGSAVVTIGFDRDVRLGPPGLGRRPSAMRFKTNIKRNPSLFKRIVGPSTVM